MPDRTSKERVFERTPHDDDRLAEAIAKLEIADHHMKSAFGDMKNGGVESVHVVEAREMIRSVLDYLRGVEVKNEVEEFSNFNDVEG